MEQHEVKCEHCGEWVSPKNETCSNCGKKLREKEKQKEQESKAKRLKDSLEPQLIEINEYDNLIVKFFKHIFRLGQMVFYAIITFLVWLSSWIIG